MESVACFDPPDAAEFHGNDEHVNSQHPGLVHVQGLSPVFESNPFVPVWQES